jgi:hypothetical protein
LIVDCRLAPIQTSKLQIKSTIKNLQSTINNQKCPGDEREMESGLIFNQLICEFESRHPYQRILDFRFLIFDWPKRPAPLPRRTEISNQKSKIKNLLCGS